MSNVKVCVKIHPLSQRDIKLKKEEQWMVTDNNTLQCTNLSHPCKFTFDRVFGTKSLNYEVYSSIVQPIFESCLIGFNGTILAYGSSSAGKNYTMIGTSIDPGILLITIERLFIKIGGSPHHTIRFGYIEIYKENVYDLLNDRKPVLIDRNKKFDFMLANEEIVVENFEKGMEIMFTGSYKRKSAAEDSSKLSSISHSIFRITIESEDRASGKTQISYLRFVHVAGCEAMTEIPLSDSLEDESNKSVYWFNAVIDGLDKGETNVNFNNSVLTTLLRESLAGKSNTAIVCNIRADTVKETISTLNFVSRAKNVRTLPMRNELYDVRASHVPANHHLIQLENQLKEIANLKIENFLLHNELEEAKAAAAVKKKWFGEQLKCSAFAQRKLELALMEQTTIQNGLELQIKHLIDSNEQLHKHLVATLVEFNHGTTVANAHEPNESLVLVDEGTSPLTRESAACAEQQQFDKVIETGCKRKSSQCSESDWSECSEAPKCVQVDQYSGACAEQQQFDKVIETGCKRKSSQCSESDWSEGSEAPKCVKVDQNRNGEAETVLQMDPSPIIECTRTRNRDKSETCTVTVRNSFIGRLIGRGGCRLKNIRDTTGTHIAISERNGDSDRSVTVYGNSKSVSKAVDMIRERLERDN